MLLKNPAGLFYREKGKEDGESLKWNGRARKNTIQNTPVEIILISIEVRIRIAKALAHRPLHKWRPDLNNNTYTSLASYSCFKTKDFSHECEAKNA